MNWTIVNLDDVAASPWRNGGGVTRELGVWPATQDWIWRMSVAEVAASGPFSHFEGIERWFAVLRGAGVCLDVDGAVHTLTASDAPFQFDGGAVTECTLLQGETRDFNLMVRKKAASAHMERICGDFGTTLSASKMIAVYAMESGATIQFCQEQTVLKANTLAWSTAPPGADIQVESEQALWMEMSV